jgi:hypothetical protein
MVPAGQQAAPLTVWPPNGTSLCGDAYCGVCEIKLTPAVRGIRIGGTGVFICRTCIEQARKAIDTVTARFS